MPPAFVFFFFTGVSLYENILYIARHETMRGWEGRQGRFKHCGKRKLGPIHLRKRKLGPKTLGRKKFNSKKCGKWEIEDMHTVSHIPTITDSLISPCCSGGG